MKKAVLIAVLMVSVSGPGFSQEKIEDIVKSAPPRGRYPEASAVVVRSSQTFTLDQQGNRGEENFRALEIFNLTGREKFSDFRIPYDKNEERLEVLLARTYKGDGSAVDVEEKAVNDVTPPELAEADMYANVLHRVLSFPAVDPGSVLVVRYKREKEKAGSIEGVVLFQHDEPMIRKELRIVIPQDTILKSRLIGLQSELKEELSGEQKIYTLAAADSPQIKPEEWMPPIGEIASRVVFSSYADWADACRDFRESFYRAVLPTEEVKKITASIVKGASGEPEKIRKIFLFVAREVRSVRFAFGEAGFEVHPAGTVLKNRYGDWKDKSGLLVAMLKAAGIEAYPVLVHSRAIPPEEEVPTLKQFDAVLVMVPPRGSRDPLFLNPFADDSLYGYFQDGRGARGLAVKPQSAEFLSVRCLPEAESVLRTEIQAEIDATGAIRAEIACDLGGLFDQRARQQLKDMTAKELDVFYTESINKVCEEGKAINNKLSDPKDLTRGVRISQEFSGSNFGLFQGPVMLVYIPPVPYPFAEVPSPPSLAKRLYPFRMQGEAEVYSTVVLKIPAGFKPLYIPEGFRFQKEYGEFSFSSAYDAARSSVIVKKTLLFRKKEISLAEYEDFKKTMDAFGIAKNNLILLEKK